MRSDLFLSVVIPVYNEEKRVFHIEEVLTFFNYFSFDWELIIVNDGSQDRTLEALQAWQDNQNFRIISYDQNKGKGYAIKQGMIRAAGRYRLFMDIDLSTPLDEFNKFLPLLGTTDIIIGTRKSQVGQIIEPQPKLREMLGKGFTKLSQLILKVKVSDFTCGFKCFSAEAARIIFPRMKIERWGFDSEILFLAKKFGLSVREVGVRWRNDPHTKVDLKRDIWRSFSDLIQIRLNDRRGAYF